MNKVNVYGKYLNIYWLFVFKFLLYKCLLNRMSYMKSVFKIVNLFLNSGKGKYVSYMLIFN